jgi:hypothetical protein
MTKAKLFPLLILYYFPGKEGTNGEKESSCVRGIYEFSF